MNTNQCFKYKKLSITKVNNHTEEIKFIPEGDINYIHVSQLCTFVDNKLNSPDMYIKLALKEAPKDMVEIKTYNQGVLTELDIQFLKKVSAGPKS